MSAAGLLGPNLVYSRNYIIKSHKISLGSLVSSLSVATNTYTSCRYYDYYGPAAAEQFFGRFLSLLSRSGFEVVMIPSSGVMI